MSNQESQSNHPKRDRFFSFRRRIKSAVYLKLHGLWWGFLWAAKLGKPYSKAMCRLKLYRKFPDGRCMYCGIIK